MAERKKDKCIVSVNNSSIFMINVRKKTQPRAHRRLIWVSEWCGLRMMWCPDHENITFWFRDKMLWETFDDRKSRIFFFLRSEARVRLRFGREDEDRKSGSRMELVLNHLFTEKSNSLIFFLVWFRPANHCDRFPLSQSVCGYIWKMPNLWAIFLLHLRTIIYCRSVNVVIAVISKLSWKKNHISLDIDITDYTHTIDV